LEASSSKRASRLRARLRFAFAALMGTFLLSANAVLAAKLVVVDGLAMRLESIDGVFTDETGAVSDWQDLTGNGHNASQNVNPDRRPIRVNGVLPSGAAAVRFDGNDDLLTVAGQVLTSPDFAIFAVVNATPTGSGHRNLFGNWSAAQKRFGDSVFVGITGYQKDSDSATVRFSDAKPSAGRLGGISRHFLLDFNTRRDPTPGVAQVSRNGLPIFTSTALGGRNLASDPDLGPYTIGVQGDPDHGTSAGEYWPGDIAALLVYNRALSAEEQAQVRQYLNDTYFEPVAPTIVSLDPPADAVVTSLTSIRVAFSEPVKNVDATDLVINGVARSTRVVVVNAQQYVFEFEAPAFGAVTVGFAQGHGIVDLASKPNALVASSWSYKHVNDPTPPTVTADPVAGSRVAELIGLTLIFSEGVKNVDAQDLLINGQAIVTRFRAASASEYAFEFPEPAFGPVRVSFAAGHGITDLASLPNPFTAVEWQYTLNPSAPLTLAVTRGLAMRLEAGVGVTADGDGKVSEWLDQSGRKHHAKQNADPERRPTLVTGATATGASALRFDGGDDLLTIDGQVLTNTDFTIFAAVNATPTGAGHRNLFGNWSAAQGRFGDSVFVGLTAYQADTDSARVRFTDAIGNAGTATAVSAHFVLDFVTDGSLPGFAEVTQNGRSIYTGGVLGGRNLASDPERGPYTIGVQGDPDHGTSAGEYWPGDIAAVLVYNRALSSSERLSVRRYLSESYVAKDVTAPRVASTDPPSDVFVNALTSVTVVFDENVRNVDASDLRINGTVVVATLVVNSPRSYTFQFPQPVPGAVTFSFGQNHGITDQAYGRNPFAGATWSVTLNPDAPASLPQTGLVMRLEAGQRVTTDASGNVSSWGDQTANGHNATQTVSPGRRPRLVSGAMPSGAPALRFDGADDLFTLDGQVLSSPNFSIFAVVSVAPTGPGNKNLFGNWAGAVGRFGNSVFVGIAGYQAASSSARVRFTDQQQNAGTVVNLGSAFMLGFVTGDTPPPGASGVYQNGTSIFNGPPLTGRNLAADPAQGPYTIGAQGDPDHGSSAGEYWHGDVAALIAYDRALSAQELVRVQRYLDFTYLQARPTLAIRRVALPGGPGVRISWPEAGKAGFVLQSTTTLSGAAWVELGPATIEGGERVVTDPINAAGAKFYRLRGN